MLARMDEEDEAVADSVRQLVATSSRDPITVEMGGASEVFREIQETVETDLARAESIAFPITLGLLVVVFGSLVAASLPLVVGGIAIIGTFLALSLINQVTDVSIFALNLTTALGLGLGIDYWLFMVSRFREELAAGRSSDDAVVATVETAGRTVAFSAVTVAISLGALLVFPLGFLRSFAYAGAAVVLIAGMAAGWSSPCQPSWPCSGPRSRLDRSGGRHRPRWWRRARVLGIGWPTGHAPSGPLRRRGRGPAPRARLPVPANHLDRPSDDRVLPRVRAVQVVQDLDLRRLLFDDAATVTVVAPVLAVAASGSSPVRPSVRRPRRGPSRCSPTASP